MNNQKNKTTNKRTLAGYFIFTLIGAALVSSYYYFCTTEEICNKVSTRFSFPYRRMMARFSSFLAHGSYSSLSLSEFLFTLFAVAFLLIVLVSIILILKNKGSRFRTFLRSVWLLVIIMLFVWAIACWTWNVEYQTTGFAENAGLDSDGTSVSDLIETTEYFVNRTNELSKSVPRDDDNHLAITLDDCFSLEGLYNEAFDEEFPYLAGYESYTPKAMILYSKIMSRIGFTGITFPLTGEANINIDAPICYIPATVAHELAHQRGVAHESETNFVGIAACMLSGNDIYDYSGSLLATVNLMNALYSADYDEWLRLYRSLSIEIAVDWEEHSAYWEQYESKVSDTADKVYDSYLKSSGDDLGVKSYGACVDILVTWYLRSLSHLNAEAVS